MPADGGAKKRRTSGSTTGVAPSEEVSQTTWQKALKKDAYWDKESFEGFYDVVYCLRQVLGLVAGVVWGLLPLTGATGLGAFIAVNLVVPFVYYSRYAKVDEDDFGRMDLVKEGFQPALGLFLTSWVVVYHYRHGQYLTVGGTEVPPAS